MLIPIDQILVIDRGRRVLHNITQLAESIQKYGLLHPIVVVKTSEEEYNTTAKTWKLIVGERRFRAHQELNKNKIEATLREDLEPIFQKEIELEENLQREAMEWQEEVLMVQSIHKLQIRIHRTTPERWTVEKTAQSLGRSKGGVSEYLKLAVAIEQKVEEVISCRTISGALGKYAELREKALMRERARKAEEERQEKKKNKEDKEDDETDNETDNEENNNKIDKEENEEDNSSKFEPSFEIIHGDCLNELAYLSPNSVDLIITDPPWGINIEESGRFETSSVHFDDSTQTMKNIIHKVCPLFFKILVEHSHLYLFCAIDFFNYWKENLEKVGFVVRPQPLIWAKDGGGYTDTNTKFMSSYELILFANKGSRMLGSVQKDVLEYKRPSQQERRGNVSTQKPVLLLRRLIELSSEKGDLVVDPFAGSGSTIQAAIVAERHGIGIEKEEDIAKLARFHCNRVAMGF